MIETARGQHAIVTALTIYPVKSLRGIALERAQLTAQGLAYDRQWMIVDQRGRFMTQRQLPRMALIETALSTKGLVLSAANMKPLLVPFGQHTERLIDTQVWQDSCEVYEVSDEASLWLTQVLGASATMHLVVMASHFKRQHGKPSLLAQHTHVYFADAAPYLVVNQSSLDCLNEQLRLQDDEPVTMDRFRGNITVANIEPFTEHQVTQLSHANYQLALRFPCERCIIPTIDQQTGVKHPQKEPFRRLKSLNSVAGKGKVPIFGENAELLTGAGQWIQVGDRLRTTPTT